MELYEPTHNTYDFVIKTGSTDPNIAAQLTDEDDVPIDLSGTTVRFRLRAVGSSTMMVDSTAVLTDPVNGEVEYMWDEDDAAEAGNHLGEFAVDYSGETGSNFDPDEYFPSDGYLDIKVVDSL